MHVCPNCADLAVPDLQKLLAIPLVAHDCFACEEPFQCSTRGWISWAALVLPSLLGGPAGALAGAAAYLALQTWWVTLRPASGISLP